MRASKKRKIDLVRITRLFSIFLRTIDNPTNDSQSSRSLTRSVLVSLIYRHRRSYKVNRIIQIIIKIIKKQEKLLELLKFIEIFLHEFEELFN